MEFVWVDLQHQPQGADVWVSFEGGGMLQCYLIPSSQFSAFVKGDAVDCFQFDVAPPEQAVQIPREGPWHVVMRGVGAAEVRVSPPARLDANLRAILQPEKHQDPTPDPGAPHLTQRPLHSKSDPRSLEDMLLPAGRADPKALAPKVDPNSPLGKQIAVARRSLLASGWSPEEVERAINNVFFRANQQHTPPTGPSPEPGFADTFGDTWDGFFQGVRNLVGQGGRGAPGVLESWKNFAIGIGETYNLYESIPKEIKHALDSPNAAAYAGEKAAQGVLMIPGLIFGPGVFAARGALSGVARGGHTDVDVPVERHTADAPGTDHTVDAEHVAPYGVEDTAALLTASENAGGHLIERHVGQTFDDLSARLNSTELQVVSSFDTADEAASAVGTALQHNQQAIDEWVSNGAAGKLVLDAPFSGGQVLHRGSAEAVAGSGVKLVLKSDGTGGWYVLTGFPTP